MVLVNLPDKLAHKGRMLGREVVILMRISTQVVQGGLSVMYNQFPIALTNAQHIGLVELPIQMVMLALAAFAC